MKFLTHLVSIVLGLAVALIAAEGLLRLLGEEPGPIPVPLVSTSFAYRPPFTENSATGWQLKPGDYLLATGGRDRKTRVSINPDASRATRPNQASSTNALHRIVFIGDSYTFGEGLDNEETLPWQLQELRPDWKIVNHGVGGFGTCQSMLRLEQLTDSLSPGDSVVYGFSSFHEERSTADPRQDFWIAITSPSHRSGYPRCRLNDGQFVREDSPVWNPPLPLTGQSVLSKVLTDAWLGILASRHKTDQRKLTYVLMKKMKTLTANRGASFTILLQEVADSALKDYQEFMHQSGIGFVDGTQISNFGELKLPDGHPGPGITKLWAWKLADYLSADSEKANWIPATQAR